MILYIDETENEQFFIVSGLLVDSKESIDSAYKKFKKSISNIKIKNSVKRKIFTEFKSTLIDNSYQKIKTKMLKELISVSDLIIFSCYIKKSRKLSQNKKEFIYISLLEKIINSLETVESIHVIFDSFNKADFEEKIIKKFLSNPKINSIVPIDSRSEFGLQFIDNVCSVIRLHKSNSDSNNYFKIIEKITKEI